MNTILLTVYIELPGFKLATSICPKSFYIDTTLFLTIALNILNLLNVFDLFDKKYT